MKVNKITLMVMGLALASLFASCKKNENNNGTASGKGFKALTEQDGNGRTYLDGVDVKWSTGDQIKVYNGEETRVFGLTEGENSTSGSFNTSNGQLYDYSGPFSAAYPSSQVTSMGNATASFSVPATQTFKAGSFGEGAMPMVAYSTDQTLAFKNLFGGLCFPLYGDNLTVKKVVLTTEANEALWGTFDVTISTSEGDPTLGAISNGDATAMKSVTLDCGDGIQLGTTAASATEFYIMVPPGTLEAGFTVTAYNENDIAIFTKSTVTAPGTNFIQRNMVRKVNGSLKIETINVTTISPTFITTNSALGLGMVDVVPLKCGFVYTDENHLGTAANDYFHFGESGVSSIEAVTNGTRFEASLASLTSDKVYYVRAWAENNMGLKYYGNPIPFATRYDYYSSTNNGKSRAVFSVGDNTQVYFSMGNLQYQASTDTWRFADYQFEYVGNDNRGFVYANGMYPDASLNGEKHSNTNTGPTNTQWMDLFGWSTSGYNHGAICYQPWSVSETGDDYNAYGGNDNNLNTSDGRADWGYNAISNGGNTENSGWRTPQGYNKGNNTAEWDYLFNSRSCPYRYSYANVYVRGTSTSSINNVNGMQACGVAVSGMILYPDSFVWPIDYFDVLETINQVSNSGSYYNGITEAQWSLLEKQGAIFLPQSGTRQYGVVSSDLGFYWSSTTSGISARYLLFYSSLLNPINFNDRAFGMAVRLIQNAN